MKYLIAGLGNIGMEYELTRHNIGFLVLDQLADQQKVQFAPARLADKAEFKYKGRSIHLIKPSTFMNLSGKAVAYWLQALNVPRENLLVIVDEIALPFGTLRMRTKGSAGGSQWFEEHRRHAGRPGLFTPAIRRWQRIRQRAAGGLRAKQFFPRTV